MSLAAVRSLRHPTIGDVCRLTDIFGVFVSTAEWYAFTGAAEPRT